MSRNKTRAALPAAGASLVLYCLICKTSQKKGPAKFLLIEKNGSMTFPPTKFRPGEDLYHAMVRPMEDDLGLKPATYFPEEELPMIPCAGKSPRYPGLTKKWNLYPVVVSLTAQGMKKLQTSEASKRWQTLDKIAAEKEPNVRAIVEFLTKKYGKLEESAFEAPSMDALACHWASTQKHGIRLVRKNDIAEILAAGSRAFNLRVADPYLPYQRQGFGFTWSFFTPKDKQDVHVHGLPAVEIYGVVKGRLMLWHKPMNQRGVRTWRHTVVNPGDWVEVEPLTCHFACWLDSEGLGTVVKAARGGELAGVGRLGIAGKTTCQWEITTKGGQTAYDHCNVYGQCQLHPAMQKLVDEYSKPFAGRSYRKIASIAEKIADKAE
jgi:hypothetical protein